MFCNRKKVFIHDGGYGDRYMEIAEGGAGLKLPKMKKVKKRVKKLWRKFKRFGNSIF